MRFYVNLFSTLYRASISLVSTVNILRPSLLPSSFSPCSVYCSRSSSTLGCYKRLHCAISFVEMSFAWATFAQPLDYLIPLSCGGLEPFAGMTVGFAGLHSSISKLVVIILTRQYSHLIVITDRCGCRRQPKKQIFDHSGHPRELSILSL
jgi:hypothetical protein